MAEKTFQAGVNILPYSITPVALNRIVGSTSLLLGLQVYAEEGVAQNINLLEFSFVDDDEDITYPMTIVGAPTSLEGILSSPAGTTITLEWDIKEDVDTDYFNRVILIKAGLSDGENTSKESTRYFAVSKLVIDNTVKKSEIPSYALGNTSSMAAGLPRKKEN